MPKFEISYGEILWYHGTIEAENEDDAMDLIWNGDREVKCCGSELYDGIDIKEIKNDDR